jgi:hypothetical protein
MYCRTLSILALYEGCTLDSLSCNYTSKLPHLVLNQTAKSKVYNTDTVNMSLELSFRYKLVNY